MKISQSLLVSKEQAKYDDTLTHAKHFEGKCILCTLAVCNTKRAWFNGLYVTAKTKGKSDWLGNWDILKHSALFCELGKPERFKKASGALIGCL